MSCAGAAPRPEQDGEPCAAAGTVEEAWMRPGAAEEWTAAKVCLERDCIVVAGDEALPAQIALSHEHYVGDSVTSDRPNAFLVSDLIESYYFAVDSEDAKRRWMTAIAARIRELDALRRQNGCASPVGAAQEPVLDDSPKKSNPEPNPALERLHFAESLLRSAYAEYEKSIARRQQAEARAGQSLLTQEQTVEKENKLRLAEEERKKEAARREADQRREQAQQERLRLLQDAQVQREREETEELIRQKRAQELRKKSSGAIKPKGGAILSRVQAWNSKVENHLSVQTSTPFKRASLTRHPRPGDPDYGRAKEGSRTAERAASAQEWVDKEINKFLAVFREIANAADGASTPTVKFGTLFEAYQEISDSLVGIMMRAKKRGLIDYEGDMLFQGRHSHVEVRMLAPAT